MSKKIELVLTKVENSISIINKTQNDISLFEDDDVGRKAFVQYMVEEFLNKEVKDGRKYK